MLLAESPGTIILPTGEIGRYTLFIVSLSGTEQPANTSLALRASASVTENINSAIRDLRNEDEWVWILGDDHVWQGNCLMRLLAIMDDNPDVDILVPLVSKRSPPWLAVVFHADGQDHEGYPMWKHYDWSEIPSSGIFEVEAAGSAGMLIKREVLDKMTDPWFASSDGSILNEDVMFCVKARVHGYRVFATSDVVMGHLGVFNVHPKQRDGKWGSLVEFSTPEEQFKHIFMPAEALGAG